MGQIAHSVSWRSDRCSRVGCYRHSLIKPSAVQETSIFFATSSVFKSRMELYINGKMGGREGGIKSNLDRVDSNLAGIQTYAAATYLHLGQKETQSMCK